MFQSAETLPTFIKRKHPRKGEEQKKGGGPVPKARQANSPKDVSHKVENEPLRWKPPPIA
jgi:hypothetical protein